MEGWVSLSKEDCTVSLVKGGISFKVDEDGVETGAGPG